MKSLCTIVAVLVAVALIGSTGAITLQQQASADHPVGGAKTFKEVTNEFEKNIINKLREAASPTDMREVLSDYIVNVNRIFLPDPILTDLIQNYERDVTTIFDQQPPNPDKQIKDFRATTHDFVKAVIDLIEPHWEPE